jgi:hypothetical protein
MVVAILGWQGVGWWQSSVGGGKPWLTAFSEATPYYNLLACCRSCPVYAVDHDNQVRTYSLQCINYTILYGGGGGQQRSPA